MLHVKEKDFNSVNYLVNYEDNVLTKKLKSATWRPAAYQKLSNILRCKKVYGLKISETIIYVKEYFYIFCFHPERYYISPK